MAIALVFKLGGRNLWATFYPSEEAAQPDYRMVVREGAVYAGIWKANGRVFEQIRAGGMWPKRQKEVYDDEEV